MTRSRPDSGVMLALLRGHLRREGWTARRIASELQVGEATAKRWLAGRALTLDRFEALAALCNLTLADLAREAEEPDPSLAHELTLAQERELSGNVFLSLIFLTLLSGTTKQEVEADFGVPEATIEAALTKLERLALIDRLPGGRVRPLVDRALVWRRSPMRALFEQHMKPQFTTIDYASEDAVYASEFVKLSDKGAATLAEMIESFRRDVQALAHEDRRESVLNRHWHAMLAVMRRVDIDLLRKGEP